MKRFTTALVGMLLMLTLSMSWALPTLQQVETEVQGGNYAQAETMMKEVVTAKPESAKAHYIYAEILAHNARFASASTEAAQARKLDPSIGFTDPVKFSAFEDLLKRQQSPSASTRTAPVTTAPTRSAVPSTESTAPMRSGGVPPVVWLVGLLVIGFVLWRGLARSRAASAGAAGMGGAGYAPAGMANGNMNSQMAPGAGYSPGAVAPMNQGGYYNNPGFPGGQPMQQARQGSGMLGTGMAVAGGVAGGMLLDRMLNNRHEGGAGQQGAFDQGGTVNPAAFDSPGSDAAAGELENRSVDFGSGSDWDSGAGGDSFDVGGGGGGSSDDGWS
ncbi:MAG: tetratricopeptide repeat protein [Rhizobacter sp.]|nr:tetratricopeptide repeat protein [Rhizobacter sp.]